MSIYKQVILTKICYTKLVYGRINKKLNIQLSNDKIEKLIFSILSETAASEFQKIGKNIYITNKERNIKLTINSLTYRVITAEKMTK